MRREFSFRAQPFQQALMRCTTLGTPAVDLAKDMSPLVRSPEATYFIEDLHEDRRK
ncbi:hypothetical protein [Phytopseudomonas punonensis]|uniref:Uncharacterized protein n=1 Tax=Phytopseudomonas punonensis TaxID=1220495 RepID=A0A1M7GHT1_9GAMM|nr:hypothetical protein [Pseudomonas punonensis]SHM15944.1 hypothetical protein SAMN05216288_3193 [Pseudomonas punonensis]